MLQETPQHFVSENQYIVDTFLSDFYRNNRMELFEIISPTFTYYTPFSGMLNFLEYVEWMSNLAPQRNVVKICAPETMDDIEFTHKFIMNILDFKLGFEEELIGETTIIVKNGLIEHVENKYKEEISNPKMIQRITAKFALQ